MKNESGKNDMINSITEAGNCFKMSGDLSKAAEAYSQAIMSYEDSQRYGQCAKYQKEIAEMYETGGDFDSAIACYQKVIHITYIYIYAHNVTYLFLIYFFQQI
jgi:tetratricopeptide (TPR) repeat protein